MIRDFRTEDLDVFQPNGASDFDDVACFNGGEDCFEYKYTLDDGNIKAIILFRDNGEDDWAGFFLISKHFNCRDGVKIKRFINETVDKYQAKRLWTVSEPNEILSRWHKFLGMDKEGTVEVDGSLQDVWSMRWVRG